MRQQWKGVLVCAVLALMLAWNTLGSTAAAEAPQDMDLTVRTWISYELNSSEITGKIRVGDVIYFNYELLDDEGSECDPLSVGLSYQVTLTLTAENGAVLAETTLNDARNGGLQIVCPETAVGQLTGRATVTGGANAQGQLSWQLYGNGPEIVVQPTPKTVLNGKTAVFTVVATGENLTYRWYYTTAGSTVSYVVSGATGSTLEVTANAQNSGRSYFCKISDANTAVTTRKALLTTRYLIRFDANDGGNAPAAQIKNHGLTLKLTSARPTLT